MPEYLAPGVYVEETSYRAKSIEGVSTSTAGFVGAARFGPARGLPVLVTGFEEYQRYFGDAADLLIAGVPVTNHLAHGVRLFFENGGKRCYVARAIRVTADANPDTLRAASVAISAAGADRFLRARFPGRAGNLVVRAQVLRSANLLTGGAVMGVRPGDVVEVTNAGAKERVVTAAGGAAITGAQVFVVSFNAAGAAVLSNSGGTLDLAALPAGAAAQKLVLNLAAEPNGDGSTGGRTDVVTGLSAHPDSPVFIGTVLRHEDPANGIEPPADRSQRIFLDAGTVPAGAGGRADFARDLLIQLVALTPLQLTGGSDGITLTPTQYEGLGAGDTATGLASLAEMEDIAIVAAPGAAALSSADDRQAVRDALITHCETLKYRFAILAGEANADSAAIRGARALHDSKYAALYYPWLVTRGQGASGETMLLSPEGAMAGIYARSDIERGVHKAPANETVRGILRFSRNVTKGEQDVLNPEGINAFRYFEGRGLRIWGARTISSDPEWIYLNVRRLFIFLEHSIDRGTQWAVFEPNNEELWLKVRLTIESFLTDVWRTGALMGTRPEEAFFVRCDRTTMSQGDLDNGRLVVLIGVAPTKPAEFVIFRIGQWTADASLV